MLNLQRARRRTEEVSSHGHASSLNFDRIVGSIGERSQSSIILGHIDAGDQADTRPFESLPAANLDTADGPIVPTVGGENM